MSATVCIPPADARVLLALAEHHAPKVKDRRTRSLLRRAINHLRVALDAAAAERLARRRAQNSASQKRRRALVGNPSARQYRPCPDCGGPCRTRSARCWACHAMAVRRAS
jgi:hypothetical protein